MSSADTEIVQAALDAAEPGELVQLESRPYLIDAPLRIPSGVALAGVPRHDRDGFGYGTVIDAMTSFPADGTLLELERGQSTSIRDLVLDGSALTEASAVAGIRAVGYVHGVHMRDVTIRGVTGHGVELVRQDGEVPYSWYLDNVQQIGRNDGVGRNGFHMIGTDHVLIGCRTLGIRGTGFRMEGCPNSKLIGCNAEWSMWDGFHVAGSYGIWQGSGGIQIIGCSTDRNRRNGLLIDASGNATVVVSGCSFRRDGANGWPGKGGGGYAGLRVQGATVRVVADGVSVYPGVNDDGQGMNSPEYGARVTDSAWVALSSGYYHGAAVAIGATGTTLIGSTVGRRTGPTNSPSPA